jgi:hypothetical protein
MSKPLLTTALWVAVISTFIGIGYHIAQPPETPDESIKQEAPLPPPRRARFIPPSEYTQETEDSIPSDVLKSLAVHQNIKIARSTRQILLRRALNSVETRQAIAKDFCSGTPDEKVLAEKAIALLRTIESSAFERELGLDRHAKLRGATNDPDWRTQTAQPPRNQDPDHGHAWSFAEIDVTIDDDSEWTTTNSERDDTSDEDHFDEDGDDELVESQAQSFREVVNEIMDRDEPVCLAPNAAHQINAYLTSTRRGTLVMTEEISSRLAYYVVVRRGPWVNFVNEDDYTYLGPTEGFPSVRELLGGHNAQNAFPTLQRSVARQQEGHEQHTRRASQSIQWAHRRARPVDGGQRRPRRESESESERDVRRRRREAIVINDHIIQRPRRDTE